VKTKHGTVLAMMSTAKTAIRFWGRGRDRAPSSGLFCHPNLDDLVSQIAQEGGAMPGKAAKVIITEGQQEVLAHVGQVVADRTPNSAHTNAAVARLTL
jgi:hypothetical protein